MQKIISTATKFLPLILITGLLHAQGSLDKSGEQWEPMEWSLTNLSYSGNPFDLVATVTFEHSQSSESRKTQMFYAGDNTWKFRFTGTQAGTWTFTTDSDDPELNGKTGTISISTNPGAAGFVTKMGDKWARTGTQKAFVPQFVMYKNPSDYYDDPTQIDNDIQTFLVEHGFNGFHTSVYLSWFELGVENNSDIAAPEPDFRTFEALELLILKRYEAGGVVHIWAWGDNERGWTPSRWGINGYEDKRLQRYIAARLGPLPGWTMSYGFDLWEWVNQSQLTEWHDYMHDHLGWPHFLGARSGKNSLEQISEAMDYSSYEQHKPDYNKYVETIEMRSSKPSFSEDRFRVRDEGRSKDYNMDETRRGLWHSTMAGGVANIWGYLIGSPGYYSISYPKPEQIKTYATFFENRFLKDMIRRNDITDGVCLKRPTNKHYIFYKENTSSVQMDLSDMSGNQTVIAIDTKSPYTEIAIGEYDAKNHTWNAPYTSDWAIAIGDFDEEESFGDATPPSPPDNLRVINVD